MPLDQYLALAVIVDEGSDANAQLRQCPLGLIGNTGAAAAEGVIRQRQAPVLDIDIDQPPFTAVCQIRLHRLKQSTQTCLLCCRALGFFCLTRRIQLLLLYLHCRFGRFVLQHRNYKHEHHDRHDPSHEV
ncbi:hypothetical protein D3C85_1438270 [compost metagenome]